MTNAVNIAQMGSNNSTFRNKIINGAMVIDQRNAGASVTINTTAQTYTVDRWRAYGVTSAGVYTVQQNNGAVTSAVGYSNYLGARTTTADSSVAAGSYYFLSHLIEGFNTSDLSWGTANAKTVTLSFWVYSSLTGTFGGSLTNQAFNRSYPFTYTISVANTWEQKTITIAGDTSGTWIGATNAIGIGVYIDLGSGSSNVGTAGSWAGAGYVGATGDTKVIGTLNATFYVTGVQLEAGSTASPFEQRLYGTELALCQRYYEHSYSQGTIPAALTTVGAFEFAQQVAASSTQYGASCKFSVVKRTAPTMTFYNWNAAGNQAVNVSTGGVTSGITTRALGDSSFSTTCTTPAGTSAGQTLSMHFTASAEL